VEQEIDDKRLKESGAIYMKRDEWAYLGFGFGTAVVLGLAAWGAIELTKKIVAKHKEKEMK
jgi:hypothetical protein